MAFSLRKSSERARRSRQRRRYLAAAQVDNGRVVRGASLDLPDGLVRDGEVTDPGALGQQIKQFAAAAGLPKNVRIGVANQQIVVRVVELPRIDDDKQRDQAVRFQASEAIAMPLNEAVLDIRSPATPRPLRHSPLQGCLWRPGARCGTLDRGREGAGLKADGIDLRPSPSCGPCWSGHDAQERATVFCHSAALPTGHRGRVVLRLTPSALGRLGATRTPARFSPRVRLDDYN